MSDVCIVDGCDRIRDKKQNRKICQLHRTRMSKYKSYDLPTAPKLPARKIRGLLCHKCNVSIGAMQESIELLQSAIDYLKKHK